MGYKRILVAIDLTDEAEEVLTAARTVADQQDDPQVSAVTVVRPLTHIYGGLDMAGLSASASLEEEMRNQAIAKLTRLTAQFGISGQDTYVRSGHPASEVHALADDLDADLIVIGTHGRHGLGLLLGSTANGVLHGVQCDVLTVRVRPAS